MKEQDKALMGIAGIITVVLMLLLSSCSPRVVGTTTTTVTKSDTTYKAAAVPVPASEHTHQIADATAICDSLYKIIANYKANTSGLREPQAPRGKEGEALGGSRPWGSRGEALEPQEAKWTYHNPPQQGKPASSVDIAINDRGELMITCREAEYLLQRDSLQMIVNTLTTTHTDTAIAKCESKFHYFTVWWFYITVALIVVFIAIKSINR